VNPYKRSRWSSRNACIAEVPTCSSHDTSDQEAHYNGARFHNRAAEAFRKDDSNIDEESQSDELGAAPWQCVGGVIARAELVGSAGWTAGASAGPSCPILKSRLHERDSDEGNSRTCDQRGELSK
jgi:hypothetical protein